MKKLFVLFAAICIFLSAGAFAGISNAEEKSLTLELFWREGCPHCEEEKSFLDKILDKYPEVDLVQYETSLNPQNVKLLEEKAKSLNASVPGVPFLFINDTYIVGYTNENTTGKQIEKEIRKQLNLPVEEDPNEETVNIPILGEINPQKASLPVIAIVLGVIDGFNPCAMWILLFLISLLVNIKNRRKLFLLGLTFIITSGVIYYLFMVAWLNFFLLAGFIPIIRIIVGIAAIVAAVYNFNRYLKERKGGCDIVSEDKRKKTFDRAKKVVETNKIYIALGGIILLAISVNMIEMVCSAGLPAIFAQVLSINDLKGWEYHGLMALYILFFMIDDLFIFFTAIFTLRVTGIQNKYSQLSRIIGSIVILALGIILIAKPDLLLFG